MKKILYSLLALMLWLWFDAQKSVAQGQQLYLADPTVFYHNKTYYLYGTGSNNGFKVYTSTDKKHWADKGFALKKGDAFGTKGFWAPQIFEYKNKFYMAYTADENIAIAEASSPLGPFTQLNKTAIAAPFRMIDPFVFFDKGKVYLYHVRLNKGNRIFVAEMNNDLTAMKEETAKECITATEPWEDTQNVDWTVTEGPTVMKRDNLYYIFYSANDFRNPDYAIGYATSKTPYGPWKKNNASPILSKVQTGKNGSGHGDFFTDAEGKLNYVFHTHNNNETANGKRKTALVEMRWEKGQMKVVEGSFRFL